MRYVRELSEQETRQLMDALKSWNDAAEVRRARAVRLSSKGWKIQRIAEALNVCRRSVRNWLDRYEEGGLGGLKTRPGSGRPPKVDQHYRQVLERTVQTPPRQMGLPFSRWTLSRLVAHMAKETGVSISQRWLSEVLDRMGFSYKRPRHDLSHKRDQELYEAKKDELVGLKKGL
jgi:transposase